MKRYPYGSRPSPLSAARVAAGTLRLGDIHYDRGTVYWQVGRPAEQGRNTILRKPANGKVSEVTPAPLNVHSRVYEYGGGAFSVHQQSCFLVDDGDEGQCLFRVDGPSAPKPLSALPTASRFAEPLFDSRRQRLLCLRETPGTGVSDTVSEIVSIDPGGEAAPTVLVSGNDFYSDIQLDAHGERICYLTWNHPLLPWDGNSLMSAEFSADGAVINSRHIAGSAEESVFQPRWGPDGALYFVSDRSGWWNLYRFDGRKTDALCPLEAEFGLPRWVCGMSTYALLDERRLICAYTRDGIWQLGILELHSGRLERLDLPFTYVTQVRGQGDIAVFQGASPTRPPGVFRLNLSDETVECLQSASDLDPEAISVSVPESIRFPAEDGTSVHGFFYPPVENGMQAPPDELPPLLVLSHGGPTAATDNGFNPKIQFWTSRGIAVLDVNYRGSTGFGRPYREMLYSKWGVADVADCVAGARHLAKSGRVDGERLLIRGGSSGGLTVLAAMTQYDIFRAGACYYGISDLELLSRNTHKFEAYYNDRLIAPYPEAREIYRERSPLYATNRFSGAVIFFQGLTDRVVPPEQAEKMVNRLKEMGVPVAYLTFEGEGHGFRRSATVEAALEAELAFYAAVLGFQTADDLTVPQITNLNVDRE